MKNDTFSRSSRLIKASLTAWLLALLTLTAYSQNSPSDCGPLNCTSNDVQIIGAYLAKNASGEPLSNPFVCSATSVPVYLSLQLSTNTPRVGVSVYALVKTLSNGQPGATMATVAQCFGTALNTSGNVVTFQTPFNWNPCGTPIVLTDAFLAWGTGGADFCAGSSNFRCPGTKSKCSNASGGSYISIQVPNTNPATAKLCSSVPGGSTATFNLNSYNSAVVGTQQNVSHQGWFEGNDGANQINNPGAYLSGSKTVYGKLCATLNGQVTTACAYAPLTLTVYTTPDLVVHNPSAVCAPGTINLQAGNVTEVSSPSSTFSLSYWQDASGSTELGSPDLVASSGTYYIKATTDTDPACSVIKSVSVTINAQPNNPESGGDQSVCETNPIQKLTASATGVGLTWWNAASGGSEVSPELNAVGSATFYAQATNTAGCNSPERTAVMLEIKAAASAPSSGGDQSFCQADPLQTLTASATGDGITWWSDASGGSIVSPTLNAVGSATFYAQATGGNQCPSLTRTAVMLEIKAAPSAPSSGGNQSECQADPLQTLTASATGDGITWWSDASGGSIVSPTLNAVGSATFYAQATGANQCNSLSRTAVSLQILPTPANAVVCVTQPSLCGPAKGSMTIKSPLGEAYMYSIDNGANYQSSPSFQNLDAGSVSGIKVKIGDCISAAVSCSSSDCSQESQPGSSVVDKEEVQEPSVQTNTPKAPNKVVIDTKATPVEIRQIEISLKEEPQVVAFPNPFSETVNFKLVSPISGNAQLQLIDGNGKIMATPFRGYLRANQPLNTQYELQSPTSGMLYYRFTVGDKQATGKIMAIRQ